MPPPGGSCRCPPPNDATGPRLSLFSSSRGFALPNRPTTSRSLKLRSALGECSAADVDRVLALGVRLKNVLRRLVRISFGPRRASAIAYPEWMANVSALCREFRVGRMMGVGAPSH